MASCVDNPPLTTWVNDGPRNRKLLQKTKRMWNDRNSLTEPFHSGVILSSSPPLSNPLDAESFCFEWVRVSRKKRLEKHKRQQQKKC